MMRKYKSKICKEGEIRAVYHRKIESEGEWVNARRMNEDQWNVDGSEQDRGKM